MQVSMPRIFESKKFGAAAIASIISFFAIREGFTNQQIALTISPLLTFIVGQGVADIGKEKAKVEAAPIQPVNNINNTTA